MYCSQIYRVRLHPDSSGMCSIHSLHHIHNERRTRNYFSYPSLLPGKKYSTILSSAQPSWQEVMESKLDIYILHAILELWKVNLTLDKEEYSWKTGWKKSAENTGLSRKNWPISWKSPGRPSAPWRTDGTILPSFWLLRLPGIST